MTTKQKSFSYSWGRGYVAEEARVEGEYHVPTLQLLKYTEGEAAGNVSVRFCHYGHAGNLRRSPLIFRQGTSDMMREALHETPELRALLRSLVED